jgi:hypothetical protein
MANKFDGDVRPLSNDPRYMGVVFSGTIDEALAQAKAAPDYGLPEQFVPRGVARSRGALLEHLNLLKGVGIDWMRGENLEDDSVEYGVPAVAAPGVFSIAHQENLERQLAAQFPGAWGQS